MRFNAGSVLVLVFINPERFLNDFDRLRTDIAGYIILGDLLKSG